MPGATRVMAGWLTPVMWLMPAALMLSEGPDGLWVALLVMLAPLVGLATGAARASRGPLAEPPLHAGILVLVAGLLIWANLALAGDVAAALGAPRWHGVVLTGGPALILALWRRVPLVAPALLAIALGGMLLPLLVLAQASGMGPLRAWEALATRRTFRFPSASAWVTDGRELSVGSSRPLLTLDEEQRISAPAGGTVHVHTREGTREAHQDWTLGPGQAIAPRPGDRLEAEPGTRLRFEAERRVPGAPASGAAWAVGRPSGWLARLGVGVTLLGGAIALLSEPRFVAPRRRTAALAGGLLLVALGWGQSWTVYGALQAPDLFLGGVTLSRVVEVPALAFAQGQLGSRLQAVLLIGLLAAFVATSAALIERPGAADSLTRADVSRDLGLWLVVFAGAGAASLWPVSPWAITLWGLGLAASSLAPGAVLPAPSPRLGRAVTALGLAVFVVLHGLRWLSGAPGGVTGAVFLHPVIAAVAVALAFRWVAGRLVSG